MNKNINFGADDTFWKKTTQRMHCDNLDEVDNFGTRGATSAHLEEEEEEEEVGNNLSPKL